MDGTTLNNKGKLSDKNLRFLQKASNEGVLIVPATGRCVSFIPKQILELKTVRYAISSNGSRLTDLHENKLLRLETISNECAISVINKICKWYMPITLHYDNKCIDSSYILTIIRAFLLKNNFSSVVKHNLKKIILKKELCLEKIQLFSFFQKDLLKSFEMREFFKDLKFSLSSHKYIEITNKEASKGQALKFLCEKLSIDKEKVIAVGDDENDRDMLEYVGIPIVVSNAKKNILNLAKYVAPPNHKDALAYIIKNFL